MAAARTPPQRSASPRRRGTHREPPPPPSDPAARLAPLKRRFIERFFLRFHMVAILGGSFFAGVIANWALFHAGVRALVWRYPIAVVAAYGAFFALIRLWLGWIARRDRASSASSYSSSSSGPDLSDLLQALPDGVSSGGGGGGEVARAAGEAFSGGGGGQSGGAGATWEDGGASEVLRVSLAQPAPPPPSGGSGGVGSLDLDVGDEGAVLVIVFGLLAAVIFGAGIYLVVDAPDILSEAALQLALASGLWRGSRQLLAPGWAGSVARKTWIPFAVVALMAVLAGAVAGELCPQGARLVDIYAQCVQRP